MNDNLRKAALTTAYRLAAVATLLSLSLGVTAHTFSARLPNQMHAQVTAMINLHEPCDEPDLPKCKPRWG